MARLKALPKVKPKLNLKDLLFMMVLPTLSNQKNNLRQNREYSGEDSCTSESYRRVNLGLAPSV